MVTKKAITEIQDLLNDYVATHAVYIFKLYHRHFYVKGPHFFTLHEKFEELYDEAIEDFDELAERLLSIGGQPYSSMAEFLEHSALKEYTGDKNAKDTTFVSDTVEDLNTIRKNLIEGIKLTGDAGDDTTQDLLIGYKTNIDKHLWMLEAFLGNEVSPADPMDN